MINEVKYSKFVVEGHIENMIDVYELFKLYMNHRPFKGILKFLKPFSTQNLLWGF